MLWALLGALAIGLSLGLMGSGGSILTVPVLTYLIGQEEKVAIAGSLAIVGLISLFAGLPYARQRLVDYRSLLFFGLPGMAGSYLGAYLAGFVSGRLQLIVFAGLMLVAGVMMLRPPRLDPANPPRARARWKIVLDGVVVGLITGFVGVGGGFMIVPALVLLGGLPMHRAVGTSLFIIALKSASGFYKYLDVLGDLGLRLDWRIIGIFTVVGIAGSLAGKLASARVPQEALKRGFAIFLFIIGVFIVLRSWSESTSGSESHVGAVGTGDPRGFSLSFLEGEPLDRQPRRRLLVRMALAVDDDDTILADPGSNLLEALGLAIRLTLVEEEPLPRLAHEEQRASLSHRITPLLEDAARSHLDREQLEARILHGFSNTLDIDRLALCRQEGSTSPVDVELVLSDAELASQGPFQGPRSYRSGDAAHFDGDPRRLASGQAQRLGRGAVLRR